MEQESRLSSQQFNGCFLTSSTAFPRCKSEPFWITLPHSNKIHKEELKQKVRETRLQVFSGLRLLLTIQWTGFLSKLLKSQLERPTIARQTENRSRSTIRKLRKKIFIIFSKVVIFPSNLRLNFKWLLKGKYNNLSIRVNKDFLICWKKSQEQLNLTRRSKAWLLR